MPSRTTAPFEVSRKICTDTQRASGPQRAAHLRQQIDPRVRPVDRLENGADRRRKNGLETTPKRGSTSGRHTPRVHAWKTGPIRNGVCTPSFSQWATGDDPPMASHWRRRFSHCLSQKSGSLSTWGATAASSSERISENREVRHRDWPIYRPLTSGEWPVEPLELGGEIPLLEVQLDGRRQRSHLTCSGATRSLDSPRGVTNHSGCEMAGDLCEVGCNSTALLSGRTQPTDRADHRPVASKHISFQRQLSSLVSWSIHRLRENPPGQKVVGYPTSWNWPR